MTTSRHFSIDGLWSIDLRPDPAWEQAKDRLWAMTPQERVQAMRAGRLSLRQCLHWAACRPQEVPLLDGEWEFIAAATPEVADPGRLAAPMSQRERVAESVLRCPERREPE